MNRRILTFAALTFVGLSLCGAPTRAQDTSPLPDAPVVSTSTSPAYPQVTCTSADALSCADALQLAADTRDQLSSLLQLGPVWRFPVHIHVMTPGDPLAAKINREAAAVFLQGNSLKIEAVLPSTDPSAREFIQRQYVTALLWEKFFASDTSFDKHTRLDVVPVWLVEGLREWLNEDTAHNRESIVRRAVQNQMAPSLSEVTGWHELSTDRLLGLWQRAFSFYLVDSLIKPGERRDDFQQWLRDYAKAGSSTTFQLHFPTETAWQRELADATTRSRALVFTWSETEAELRTDETITFAASKEAKVQTCTLDTVATIPRTPALIEALKGRIFILTELQLRAHPGWQAILEAYRSALMAIVIEDNAGKAKSLIERAHKLRLAETDYHQKLLDYVNWFEVTKDFSGDTSHFRSYFDTAKEMERVQADPAHPNPIRANLLLIESQL
jgi:hypothetical protein